MFVWLVLVVKVLFSFIENSYIRGGLRIFKVVWEKQKRLLVFDRVIQVGMSLVLQSLCGLIFKDYMGGGTFYRVLRVDNCYIFFFSYFCFGII